MEMTRPDSTKEQMIVKGKWKALITTLPCLLQSAES